MPMTNEEYTKKRNELLDILGNILKQEGRLQLDERAFDAATEETVKRISRDLKTNSFGIVLLGEFQGGKSTTFNAICDGRNISPMGEGEGGIKTSSCIITAHNLADPNEKEKAVIHWKTERDLILTIQDILIANGSDRDRSLFEEDEHGRFGLSLDNAEHIQLVQRCVEEEWERYARNRAAYDPNFTGKLGVLHVARVIAAFLNNSEFKERRKEPIVFDVVEKIAPYVRFPENWGSREPNEYSYEEITFAFISGVDCFIHSESLERLGCTITDCPGLFVSPWDTSIAHEAVIKADAVLYLLNGDHQIGVQDQEALAKLQASDQFHKLFFAINSKKSQRHAEGVLRRADVAAINVILDKHQQIQENDIYVFHARASYLAKYYYRIDRANEEDLEEWKDSIEDGVKTFCGLSSRRDTNKITELIYKEDGVLNEDLLSTVNYRQLMNVIENKVIADKAKTRLYHHGSKLVSKHLHNLENRYANIIEVCSANAKAIEELIRELISRLHKFSVTLKETVKKEFGNNDDLTLLADDFVRNVIERNLDRVTRDLARRFIDEKARYGWAINLTWAIWTQNETQGMKDLHRRFSELILCSVKEILVPGALGWIKNCVSGDNTIFDRTIKARSENVAKHMKNEAEGIKEIVKSNDICINIDWASLDFTDMDFSRITDYVAKIINTEQLGKRLESAVVKAFLVHAVTAPIRLIDVVINMVIKTWIKGKSNSAVNKLASNLKEALSSDEQVKKDFISAGEECAKQMVNSAIGYFETEIDKNYDIFKKVCDEYIGLIRQGAAVKKREKEIAEKKLNTTKSYSQKIESYNEGLQEYWG